MEFEDAESWVGARDMKNVFQIGKIVVVAFVALAFVILSALAIRLFWPSKLVYVDDSMIKLIGALAWPVVIISVASFLFLSDGIRKSLSDLVKRVEGVKAGEYEFKFSQADARRLKRDVENPLNEFSAGAQVAYEQAVVRHRVKELVTSALAKFCATSATLSMPNAGGIQMNGLRATVHVKDVVVQQSLYQLVDYVPGGGGSGRRFSTRFGAIGLTWRSEIDQFWTGGNQSAESTELIAKWGMTAKEAAESAKRGFAACFLLRDSAGISSGVFYIDAADLNSVTVKRNGKEDEEVKKLLDTFKANENATLVALADAVSAVYHELEKSGADIKIYG